MTRYPWAVEHFRVPARNGGMRECHEWEHRWAEEKLNADYLADNQPYVWNRYAGRTVVGGMGGEFHLVPRNYAVAMTSSQPAYILATPEMLLPVFDFPPTPEVSR